MSYHSVFVVDSKFILWHIKRIKYKLSHEMNINGVIYLLMTIWHIYFINECKNSNQPLIQILTSFFFLFCWFLFHLDILFYIVQSAKLYELKRIKWQPTTEYCIPNKHSIVDYWYEFMCVFIKHCLLSVHTLYMLNNKNSWFLFSQSSYSNQYQLVPVAMWLSNR